MSNTENVLYPLTHLFSPVQGVCLSDCGCWTICFSWRHTKDTPQVVSEADETSLHELITWHQPGAGNMEVLQQDEENHPYPRPALAAALTCEWQGDTGRAPIWKPGCKIPKKIIKMMAENVWLYHDSSCTKLFKQFSFRGWTNKPCAPGLLTAADSGTRGLGSQDVADVSLACIKFSSSKSPQSSHSSAKSGPTLALCEDDAVLTWLLQFCAASGLFKQTAPLVFNWLWPDWCFWFPLTQSPEFNHTVESEHRPVDTLWMASKW